MTFWAHKIAREQQAAIDNIAFKRRLALIRAAREAKAALKDKR